MASLVAAGARRAGLLVGLYTSPHVERLAERVVVDGAPVGDGVLGAALARALDAREESLAEGDPGAEATWFDVLTAAAFAVFAEAGVDLAVVECGLGGRLDSTNVIRGEVCVVTNVELEHTAILGGTRARIAAEKGGILEPGCTLVTGVPADDEAGRVLSRLAAGRGAAVVRPTLSSTTTLEQANRALAGAALDELGRRGVRDLAGDRLSGALLEPAVVRGARLPGRLERFLFDGVRVVLDGGHVPGSVTAVLDELEDDAALPGAPVVVLAVGADKDADGVLKRLAGRVDRVLCTSVGRGPYADARELARHARGLGVEVEVADSPRVALGRAVACVRNRGWILVIGSLHLAGALRGVLNAGSTPC